MSNKILMSPSPPLTNTPITKSPLGIISGDIEQSDKYRDKKQSGLWDAIEKFRDSGDIAVFEFKDKKDIVRNPLISKILTKYEDPQ